MKHLGLPLEAFHTALSASICNDCCEHPARHTPRQVEGSRNAKTGGYGLGLSIAHAIARAHEGRLSLSNREGGGLEVVLQLWRKS
ncbi:ATP-binding protein [Pseudomonas sp. O39]|uniref:ATP-binding protein n=1 Tax=Pseudomonas sp. O39 TaxID=3379130 RepID=UPI00387B6541